jgi:hypothetical protein
MPVPCRYHTAVVPLPPPFRRSHVDATWPSAPWPVDGNRRAAAGSADAGLHHHGNSSADHEVAAAKHDLLAFAVHDRPNTVARRRRVGNEKSVWQKEDLQQPIAARGIITGEFRSA